MGWYDAYAKERQMRDYGSYPPGAIPHSNTGGPDYMAMMNEPQIETGAGMEQYQGPSTGETMTKAAGAGASGAAAGGPVGAAIAVGGTLAADYFAQKAASERQRRQNAAQIEQQYSNNQNTGLNTIMQAYQNLMR